MTCRQGGSAGPLLLSFKFVQLRLQTLQFQPFGLGGVRRQAMGKLSLGLDPLRFALFGFPTLNLPPVCLEALLASTLPRETLRFISGSSPLSFNPRRFFGLGTFAGPLFRGGTLSLGIFSFSALALGSRTLQPIQLQPVCRRPLSLEPRNQLAPSFSLECPEINHVAASGRGDRRRKRRAGRYRRPGHLLPTAAHHPAGQISDRHSSPLRHL